MVYCSKVHSRRTCGCLQASDTAAAALRSDLQARAHAQAVPAALCCSLGESAVPVNLQQVARPVGITRLQLLQPLSGPVAASCALTAACSGRWLGLHEKLHVLAPCRAVAACGSMTPLHCTRCFFCAGHALSKRQQCCAVQITRNQRWKQGITQAACFVDCASRNASR